MSEYLGIARERVYSPGKVDADRAILDAVAERLAVRHRVRVVSADDPLPDVSPGVRIFAMCQGPAALDVVRSWERTGVRVVNSPAAIESCHRCRMLAIFEARAVPHPQSVLIPSAEPEALPAWVADGAWLKRGDVHATKAGDVVQVWDPAAAEAALEQMCRRGIETALVQRHVGGDVIKFYAVRGSFFTWLPAQGTTIRMNRCEEASMAELAERGATALGLEVFGGDCIRDGEGSLWLIDLNDWPSYAPCRAVAADAITAYLDGQSEPS